MRWTTQGRAGLPAWRDRVEDGERLIQESGGKLGGLWVDLGRVRVVAAAVRLYARGGWRRLGATWLVGVSGGVLIRAALVGHVAYDFWGVALAFTALFILAGRGVLRLRPR